MLSFFNLSLMQGAELSKTSIPLIPHIKFQLDYMNGNYHIELGVQWSFPLKFVYMKKPHAER